MRGNFRFLKHLIIYLGFNFLNRGIAFLMLPVYTRFLTPEDYGIYALLLTGSELCVPFLDFALNNAITRVYVEPTLSFPRYVSTDIFFGLVMCCVQLVVLGTVGQFYNSNIVFILMAAPLIAFSILLGKVVSWILRVEEKPTLFGCLNLYFAVIYVMINVVALVIFHAGWRGLIYAYMLTALFKILPVLWILIKNRWLILCFDKPSLRFGLKYGLGFLPTLFSQQIDHAMGRFLMANHFAMREVGIYSMGEKIGKITSIYSEALANVFQPWLFKMLAKEKKSWRKILSATFVASASIFAFAWGSSIIIYLLKAFILGEKFQGSMIYIWFCSSIGAIQGVYWFVALFISFKLKTWIVSTVTIGMIGFNFIAMWCFLDKFGLMGVVYAPMLAWGFALLLLIKLALLLWKPKRVCSEQK